MSYSQRANAALAAVVLSFGVVFALSACASPVADDAGPVQTATQEPEPVVTDDPEPEPEPIVTDDPVDPEQDTVRTGPIAQYGGPAYGDQGDAEVIEPGSWCKTIVVFWGGDGVPDGVSFTFETAVPNLPGLTVEGGECGPTDPAKSCLDLTLQADQSGISCSIVVHPGADFVEGTTVSFTGTLRCPTAEVCDAVEAREVEPGPPLEVNTPAGA